MNHIQKTLFLPLFMALVFPLCGSSQDSFNFEFGCEVNVNYQPLSISKETLSASHTLSDLNKYYKAPWVREYILVEVAVRASGKIKKANSKNNILTREQKDLMSMADVGTNISINVQYIPENTLINNEMKEFNFSFMVNPDKEATFPGGQQQLTQYLADNAIDKISESIFKQHHLTAIKFSIDKEGHVIDAHVYESSRDEKTDAILLEAIQNMPRWRPAEYSNGTKVLQELVLTVGDHRSCVINYFNLRRA